jgi:hypothetical protein
MFAAGGAWATASARAKGDPTTISKVVWIWEENTNPADIIGTCATCLQMPYLNNELVAKYGVATNAWGASTPSLPNYIAGTSGGTQGIADDGLPGQHPLTVPSLFSQLPDGEAKVFAESMPTNCSTADGPRSDANGAGFYAVRHTAWPYYTNSRASCLHNDVPLAGNLQNAVEAGLPTFSEIVPAICNDLHKADVCALGPGQTYRTRADAWLQTNISLLQSGTDWQSGQLAIFIVWDEGVGTTPASGADCTTVPVTMTGCRIPLVVMSRDMGHVSDSTKYTTYSVLRTTEELLGLQFLGRAATAASMTAAFGLGPGSPPPPTTTTSTTSTSTTVQPTTTTTTTQPGSTTTTASDTTPPTGSITSPTPGATISGTTPVTLTASDNVKVTQINLLVDGAFYATVTKSPYTFQLDTTRYANGAHSLYAKVYDAAGNKTVTATVPVTIAN